MTLTFVWWSFKVIPTIASVTFAVEYEWETVRDRGSVPKDHQQEMAYGESNGHVTDYVT